MHTHPSQGRSLPHSPSSTHSLPHTPCTQMRPDLLYTLTLTVAKGSGTYARSAAATTLLRPRSVPVPSGSIARYCGVDMQTRQLKPCPARHNPSDPLTVSLTLDRDALGATLAWRADASAGITLDASNTGGGTSKALLTLLPRALPAATSITLHVDMAKVRSGAAWSARSSACCQAQQPAAPA